MPIELIDIGLKLPDDVLEEILKFAPNKPNPMDSVTNMKRIAEARSQLSMGNGIAAISEETNENAEFEGTPPVIYNLIFDPWISEYLGLGEAGLPISRGLYGQIVKVMQASRK